MTDRDEKGRFLPGGAPKSPGRPPKATEQEYLDALFEKIPLERWKKLLEVQAKRAEKGDIVAFNALANRILPILERRQISGSDGAAIVVTLKADDD